MSKIVQTDRNVIGKTVERLCLEKGISCYGLSKRCGVPLMTIMHIVEGRTRNPGIYTMVRICRELGVSLTDCLDAEI